MREFPDTADYVHIASLPVWDPGFLGGGHPFTPPLFYKLASSEPTGATALQWTVSVLCWATLALFVARAVRSRWLKPVAVGLVLAFSLSAEIIQWDRVMLSESISLSLLALLLACWLWLLEGWSWRKAVLLLLIASLWAFARDTNAYAGLMMAGLLVVLAPFRPAPRRYLIVAGAFLAIFVAADVSMTAGYRWVAPFLHVLTQRVLPHAARTADFARLGMPLTPSLMRLAEQSPSEQDWEDPSLEDFRQWLHARGKRSYPRFLLLHPEIVAKEPLGHLGELVSPRLEGYAPPGFLAPLGGWMTALTYPTHPVLLSTLLAAALGVAGSVAIRMRPRPVWVIPLALLLLAYPLAALVWHGDTAEIGRHALQVGVQLRLGLWLLLLFGADLAASPTDGISALTAFPAAPRPRAARTGPGARSSPPAGTAACPPRSAGSARRRGAGSPA